MSVCIRWAQLVSHPSDPHLYSQTKETFLCYCKDTFPLQVWIFPYHPPNKTTRQLWLSIPKSCFLTFFSPFCQPFSRFPYIVGVWPIAPVIREVRVHDLLSVPVCMCDYGWSFRAVTPQLDSVSAAKKWLCTPPTHTLTHTFPLLCRSSACIDSRACGGIPMSRRVRRKAGDEEVRDGKRNIEMKGGVGRGHGKGPEGTRKSKAKWKTGTSNRMHERDRTAEQLQEKDKHCAVKCQGYLIH